MTKLRPSAGAVTQRLLTGLIVALTSTWSVGTCAPSVRPSESTSGTPTAASPTLYFPVYVPSGVVLPAGVEGELVLEDGCLWI